MSKAFTRESDDVPEPRPAPRPPPGMGPNTRQHLTPDGAQALQAELQRRIALDPGTNAPVAGSPHGNTSGETPEQNARRIDHLRHLLRNAVVVLPPPPAGDATPARFGAFVTVRHHNEGSILRYRLVGPEEMDLERHWIPWTSPLGRSLMNQKKGASIPFRSPAGIDTLDILDVQYAIDPSSGIQP